MAKKCTITGKGVQVGHNVSHANNKSKRRFLPNLQSVTFLSDVLGSVRLRVSLNGLRTIEKHGGIDGYLKTTRNGKLEPETLKLKKRLLKAEEKKGNSPRKAA